MNEFDPTDKSNWLWTAMICLPDAVTSAMIDDVLPAVTASKELRAGSKVRVEAFREGVAAQIHLVRTRSAGGRAGDAPQVNSSRSGTGWVHPVSGWRGRTVLIAGMSQASWMRPPNTRHTTIASTSRTVLPKPTVLVV